MACPGGKPSHLSEHGEACIRALIAAGLADRIVLGGALGLLHYLDYRDTRDADAWWSAEVGSDERQRVIRTIELRLGEYGPVRTRTWGDVVSIELENEGTAIFSFQIARRSALLGPPGTASWAEVPVDSLADLVASKMTALVERGAPRDFRDIHALCRAGLTGPAQCWTLWAKRQELSGSDADGQRARLAIETHLERIRQHRPLPGIPDTERRAEAEEVRRWFKEELLPA